MWRGNSVAAVVCRRRACRLASANYSSWGAMKRRPKYSQSVQQSYQFRENARRFHLAAITSSKDDATKPRFQTAEYEGLETSTVEYCLRKTGKLLTQSEFEGIASDFHDSAGIRSAAREEGLQGTMFRKAKKKFIAVLRKSLELHTALDPDLCNTLVEIAAGTGHVDDLYPHFMEFSRQLHPLLASMPQLRKITDLTQPASWFPAARGMHRLITFHAGPTNSGKTHAAMEHFLQAHHAIYCAPLRMLAHEMYQRSNDEGVACDLITGEEYRPAPSPDEAGAEVVGGVSSHLACTVEMADLAPNCGVYDVAVIDEVQLLEDGERGGAWTRALLGLPARHLHLCGHPCALSLVRKMAASMGESVEVCNYERLVPLVPLPASLSGSYRRVEPGDCVVVFSRSKIFSVRSDIERATGKHCAVIYGSLPPATRVEQAQLFNDPRSDISIMVATDAVGMGLNLNIRRVVFESMVKFDGAEMAQLTPSHAKQIAGRAGRFGKEHPRGEVTTLHPGDLKTLHRLLAEPVETVKQAGIYPTPEQIDVFSSHLPKAALSEILELFFKMAQVDGNYFLCNFEKQLALAHHLREVDLSPSELFRFTLAPTEPDKPLLMRSLLIFADAYASGQTISYRQLCRLIGWPLQPPSSPQALIRYEVSHELIDLYLWLSMRFPDTFVSADEAMALQEEIEEVIGYSLTYKVRRRSSKTTLREQLEEAVQTGDESLTDVGDALIGQLLQTERSLAAEDTSSWSRKRRVGGSSQRRSSSGDTERSSKRTHQRNEN